MRKAILDVIRGDAQTIGPFLESRAERTHAFLAKRRGIPPGGQKFSKFGDGGLQACILTKVYDQWHPNNRAICPNCVMIENYVDCTYLAWPWKTDGHGFPVVWEYDWAIEVENDIREFAYTLRTLLDFVSNNRVGIFFVDSPDIAKLTSEFTPSWKAFAARYAFAVQFNLQVIFFPTTYSTCAAYDASSQSFVWDHASNSFRKLP